MSGSPKCTRGVSFIQWLSLLLFQGSRNKWKGLRPNANVAVGINLCFVFNVAKKVSGKSETCCPCFTDKEIEREAFLMRLAIQEMAARYGSTLAADTAGARNDSVAVKDTISR